MWSNVPMLSTCPHVCAAQRTRNHKGRVCNRLCVLCAYAPRHPPRPPHPPHPTRPPHPPHCRIPCRRCGSGCFRPPRSPTGRRRSPDHTQTWRQWRPAAAAAAAAQEGSSSSSSRRLWRRLCGRMRRRMGASAQPRWAGEGGEGYVPEPNRMSPINEPNAMRSHKSKNRRPTKKCRKRGRAGTWALGRERAVGT